MRHFAIAAIAATAAARSFLPFDITFDGTLQDQFWLKTQDWSSASVSQRNRVTISGNNTLLMHEWVSDGPNGDEIIFKPSLRGGSIEYDVNVSGMQSGCVAGVYLVKMNDSSCGDVDQNGNPPQCQSIDALQANSFGLSTQPNPCANGTCDAISQCIVGMQNQGIEYYGEDAYGPGGTMIDTDEDFHVKNEFVADLDYEQFWKMRTTITQGDEEVMLESDCSAYISALNDAMEGEMGIIFSNWHNKFGIEDFEMDLGQSPADSCADASTEIANFTVKTWGSIESQDGPEPERELVIGEVAMNVDDCGEPDCSACNVSWYTDDEVDTFNTCTDYTSYKYANICSKWQSSALCGDDDHCFKSYPIADNKRWRSDDFACRPLPDRLEEGPFKYSSRPTKATKGLCILEDCQGNCYNSWPIDDPLKWKSADSMPRCKE